MMELMGPLCGLEGTSGLHAWSCAPSTVHVFSERRSCLCSPDAVVFMVRPAYNKGTIVRQTLIASTDASCFADHHLPVRGLQRWC